MKCLNYLAGINWTYIHICIHFLDSYINTQIPQKVLKSGILDSQVLHPYNNTHKSLYRHFLPIKGQDQMGHAVLLKQGEKIHVYLVGHLSSTVLGILGYNDQKMSESDSIFGQSM